VVEPTLTGGIWEALPCGKPRTVLIRDLPGLAKGFGHLPGWACCVLDNIPLGGILKIERKDMAKEKKERKQVRQPHKEALRRRLNRIVGQVQGIARMVEEDRYCVDVLVQLSAVKAALNQVSLQLIEDHTKGCVRQAIRAGDSEEEVIEELMGVLKKLAK